MTYKAEPEHTAQIVTEDGEAFAVPFFMDCERQSAVLTIDGVGYHLERIPRRQLTAEYRVDLDPGYQPQADGDGYCYILAPFAA